MPPPLQPTPSLSSLALAALAALAAGCHKSTPDSGPPLAPPPAVTVAVQGAWGSAPGSFGVNDDEESMPEGPMSFAVDAAGAVHVLDQLNRRIQVFVGGKPPRSVPLPDDVFVDLDLDTDGGYVLLDVLDKGALVFLDGAGMRRAAVALAGDGIPNPEHVTGVFRRADGVWAEVDHASLVHVTDAMGAAVSARDTQAGRFIGASNDLMQAALAPPSSLSFRRIPRGGAPSTALFDFTDGVGQITALEADAQGNAYVGVVLLRENTQAPFDITSTQHTLVVLDPSGKELRRDPLPALDPTRTIFRPVRMGQDGAIYQLTSDDSGVRVARYQP